MKRYPPRIEKEWQAIIKTSLIIGVLSALANMGVNLLHIPHQQIIRELVTVLLGGLVSFLLGFFNPFVIISMESFLLQTKKIKSLPFFFITAIRMGVYLGTGMILYIILGLFFFPQEMLNPGTILFTLFCILFFSLAVSFINFFQQFFGANFLRSFLLSKYHRARIQWVIFLFIDLKDSTSLAQQITSQAFFQCLNDFIYLCEEVIQVHHGIIYKYVGDSIIVVWDENRKNLQNSYQCLKEIVSHLQKNKEYFQKTYQTDLSFTMGLHTGPTTVGEIGSDKRELGYLSDTVNTAQRIQSQNKKLKTHSLLSDDYVRRLKEHQLTPDKQDGLIKYPAVLLQGKDKPLDLYAYPGLSKKDG